MKEIVICAALKGFCGEVVRGHRHRDCIERIYRVGMCDDPGYWVQGFITSKNRFVDRKEGYVLQTRAGIESANPEGYTGAGWLFSEDLY